MKFRLLFYVLPKNNRGVYPKLSLKHLIIFVIPAGLSSCLKELRRALGYTNQAIPSRFKPRCKKDGSYENMQCLKDGSNGETCWCVDSDGKELIGTRVSGKASCIPESGRTELKRLWLIVLKYVQYL